jgi:threonine dehydrogenase-like Zn-dependent dehydrogenase
MTRIRGAPPTQTVICKQAGASLIIVTGTSKDAARLEVATALGADYTINVQNDDPLARIMEITGGKGNLDAFDLAHTGRLAALRRFGNPLMRAEH